ncbi:hypothetical protein HNP48_006479, partial [Acidovorax soli]
MATHIDRYMPQSAPVASQIVFVFNDLHDWQSLAAAAPEGAEVVVLDGWGDGLAQMAMHLQGRSGIHAIHLLSHGAPGALLLGRLRLTRANLEDHAPALAGIGAALADGGDILLYGCEVGANKAGADFVEALALATRADVAASTRPIGAAHLGGTWQLEHHHGLIEAASLTGPDAYGGVLAAPTTENFDSITVDGTGRSQGVTGAARPINDWTFSLLNAAGNLDPGSYVDVTRLTGDTSLANNATDKAAYMNGTYGGGTSTQAAGVLKATSGEEFSFVSITVENGAGANTYRLVGYLNGSAVPGATQNFTAPAYGSNTTVSVSGSQWQYVDEIRIVQQNGAADISIYIDDIVVATAVPPNAAPLATTSGGTTAFTEGANVASTPVAIDSGITVSDTDNTTLASATVSITGGFQSSEDALGFTNNPATMGNINGSYNSSTGVLSLSSAGATATKAQWQAALQSVTYTNNSDTPNTSDRTISFVVNDGIANSSAATKTLSVAAVNDTPVSTASGGSTAFTEGNNAASTPVAVDSGFTVTDGDNATLASATVSISGGFQNGEDALAFTNNPATMGNISGSYNAATGVMTLTSAGATATTAQWQAALRSVTYSNSSETPNTGNRTVSFTTNDGTADGNTSTKTVTIASTNDTPVATASGGTTAFTEGANVTSTPVVVDTGITLSDVDSTTLASATVSITGGLQTSEDELAFANNPATMGNISGSYNSATGVLSLSSAGATATKAQWQAALQSVTYTNSSDTPNTGNRTISFVVNDGSTNSAASTKTVSVAAANDVPVNTTSGGNTAFVTGDNAPSTPVAVDSGFTVTDDNATLASATVAITGGFQNGEDELAFTNNPATMGNISASYNAATGVLTLTSAGATATTAQWQNALRSVTYTDTSSTPVTTNRTISFTTNDGTADGNTATKTVTVAATNQTPIATASGGTTAFTEGANVASTPVVVDSGITVTDANNATLASATVSITGGLQTSEDELAFTNNPATMGNISGSYNSATGVLSLASAGASATKAQWQAALQSVTYTNSSDSPNTGNRTVSFVVNDGSTNSAASTKTVSVAAANDVPVNTTSGGSTSFTAGGSGINPPVAVDSGFTVTDGDNATLASATVAITGGFQNGEDELAFTNNPATMGNISASYNAATGVLTLTSAGATATTAQWQNALRSVTYTDTSTTPATANRTVSFTTNDGTADSNTASKLIAMNVDLVNPTVTSVTSTKANGSYAGGTVIVQVVFSEAVTVTGAPQLTLETGAVDKVASYTGGSTTNTLTFTYSVQSGDNSADLDFQSTAALALNGGTIKDAAGNAANLTLMAPGAPGSLGANKAIVIDTLAPTLASSMPLDNATGVSASSNLTLTFSENVTAAEGLVTLRKTSDNSVVEEFNVTNGEGSLGGSVNISGTTLTLNPHGDLAYNTGYYLLAEFGIVKDGAGNYFDGIISPTALDFTTGSAPAPGGGGTTPPPTTVDGVPVTTTPGPGGSTIITIP